MSDIIPKGGATFNAVRDYLLRFGGSGITDARASSLCTRDAIKAPFAKFKPVTLPYQFTNKYTPDRTSTTPPWWTGLNGLCGFNLDAAKATSFQELVNKYNGGDNGWVYQPPQGGTADPFRIADFEGYWGSAPSIASGYIAPTTVYETTTEADVSMPIPTQNVYNLTWHDFPTLKGYHFGVVIKQNNSNIHHWVTAATPLEDSGATVTFNPSKLNPVEHTIYPFISSLPYTMDEAWKSGTNLYTLPNVAPSALTVSTSQIHIRLVATRNTDALSITWSVAITNSSGSAITLNNNSIKFRKNLAVDSEWGDGEATIANTTVPANASNYVIGSGTTKVSWNNITTDTFAQMNIWASITLGGGVYKDDIGVPKDINVGPKI